MEQDREPRNTPTHKWELYVKEMASQISGKRIAQSVNGIGHLVTHVEQNKIRSLSHIRHENKSHLKI